MIQRTIAEQQRALYWHRQRVSDREGPRALLRESDELMYWLEECVSQRRRLVPGWLMPRLVSLLGKVDAEFPRRLGGERRAAQVMELLYAAQESLMGEAIKARRPARIIPLFRR